MQRLSFGCKPKLLPKFGTLHEMIANEIGAASGLVPAVRPFRGDGLRAPIGNADWLAEHGCGVGDIQRGTLSHALRRKELDPVVRRVTPRSMPCWLGAWMTAASAALCNFTGPELGVGSEKGRNQR